MTEHVYQVDSYLKECDSTIVDISGDSLVLDRTIFHPKGGGLESDIGFIEHLGKKYKVIDVVQDKQTGEVIHHLDSTEGLRKGETVHLVLDWERRYRMMRLHTASHIISSILYSKFGALVTGGNISPDYAYDDYSLESADRAIFEGAVAKANEVVKNDIELKIYWLKRDEALKIPGIVKLASRMPPNVEVLRIVEIPGVDIQADGGPHIKRTGEIGEIVLIKVENKGKNKKRIYFSVKP